ALCPLRRGRQRLLFDRPLPRILLFPFERRLRRYRAVELEPAALTVNVAPPPVNSWLFASRCVLAGDRGGGRDRGQQTQNSSCCLHWQIFDYTDRHRRTTQIFLKFRMIQFVPA